MDAEVNGGLLLFFSCPHQHDGAGAELSGVGAGNVRQPFVKAVSQPAELEPERWGRSSWRCLERWQLAGVFDQLHRILLTELNALGELDWSRA
ncbi:hypothetical protein ACFY1U_33700 [Streptomyces sp. NPDC001351]|uniref:hypothetical protein n=1 Tax=Streptomyces sp. NPDC001351 TaxID=3364564 RepID=UPI003677002A